MYDGYVFMGTSNTASNVTYDSTGSKDLLGANILTTATTSQNAIDSIATKITTRRLLTESFTSLLDLNIPQGKWVVEPSNTNLPYTGATGILEVVLKPNVGTGSTSRYLTFYGSGGAVYTNTYAADTTTWLGWYKLASDTWYTLTHSAATVSTIADLSSAVTVISGSSAVIAAKEIFLPFTQPRVGTIRIANTNGSTIYSHTSYTTSAGYVVSAQAAVDFAGGNISIYCSANSWTLATIPVAIAANTIKYRV